MKMLKCYADGYGNGNWISDGEKCNRKYNCNGFSFNFTMINVLGNRGRVKHGANLVFFGTGYYIDGGVN